MFSLNLSAHVGARPPAAGKERPINATETATITQAAAVAAQPAHVAPKKPTATRKPSPKKKANKGGTCAKADRYEIDRLGAVEPVRALENPPMLMDGVMALPPDPPLPLPADKLQFDSIWTCWRNALELARAVFAAG
jgi:hypothetical protein